MKNRYSYGSYHGRTPLRVILKWTIFILAVILALVVAALFLLQPYKVYSDDGVRLELPWLAEWTTPASSASPPPVVETPIQVVVVSPTPAPNRPAALHAALLPHAALYDGTAKTQMEAVGANAALFDMKSDAGLLGYVSALPLAIGAEASNANPALNAAIQALNAQEDMYTVARVSCFKDDRLSNADRSLNILTNSGYLWTDPQKLKWSSPTSDQVRQYVTDVCRELAALGFDEILLDNAGYPTEGHLGYIKKGPRYDQTEFANVISDFYAQVGAALADYPEVKLSIVTSAATITEGSDPLSGQTAAALILSADRIWAPLNGIPRAVLAAQLETGGQEGAEECLVSIQGQAGAESDSWAVWAQS